jgi:hypothetical protein
VQANRAKQVQRSNAHTKNFNNPEAVPLPSSRGQGRLDAFKVYMSERSSDKKTGLKDFVDAASITFLTNRYNGSSELQKHTMQLRKRNRYVDVEDDDCDDAVCGDDTHSIIPVSRYKYERSDSTEPMPGAHALHGTSVRCRVKPCNKNAYFCCVKCSDAQGKPFGVCGSNTHRDCALKHQQQMLLQ